MVERAQGARPRMSLRRHWPSPRSHRPRGAARIARSTTISGPAPGSYGGTQDPNGTPAEVLFPVVEGRSAATQPGTVAILGLDGKARATATFQPRVGPVIPDAYTPLQGVAQVVGSGVYYIDGAGVVRVLTAAGGPRLAAPVPLQPA